MEKEDLRKLIDSGVLQENPDVQLVKAELDRLADLSENQTQHISEVEGCIGEVSKVLQDIIQSLETSNQAELSRLDELIALGRTQTEQTIESSRQFSRLTSLVKWVLIPTAVVTAINTVLLIIRAS